MRARVGRSRTSTLRSSLRRRALCSASERVVKDAWRGSGWVGDEVVVEMGVESSTLR